MRASSQHLCRDIFDTEGKIILNSKVLPNTNFIYFILFIFRESGRDGEREIPCVVVVTEVNLQPLSRPWRLGIGTEISNPSHRLAPLATSPHPQELSKCYLINLKGIFFNLNTQEVPRVLGAVSQEPGRSYIYMMNDQIFFSHKSQYHTSQRSHLQISLH